MSKFTIICFIAAGLITAANIVILIYNAKRHKNELAWYESIENRRRLKDYQKSECVINIASIERQPKRKRI